MSLRLTSCNCAGISRIVWTISITAVKISHEFTRENSQFHPNLHVRLHNFTPKKYLCHSCWSIRERKIRVRWILYGWKFSHTVQTIRLLYDSQLKSILYLFWGSKFCLIVYLWFWLVRQMQNKHYLFFFAENSVNLIVLKTSKTKLIKLYKPMDTIPTPPPPE